MRSLLQIFIGLMFVSSGALAEMSFKATVDKLSVAYEEKIQLQLEVRFSDPSTKTTPIPPPSIIGLSIGGSGSSVEREGSTTIRRYNYELVPGRSGSVTIPPFKVEFQSGGVVDTLVSEPITVDIAQPRPVSKPGSFTALYIGIVAVIVVIAAFVLWRRKKQLPPAEEIVDWREEYRHKFAEIRKLADRQDFRAFSTEAMRLIMSLVERAYETRVSGFTSTDLLRWLEEKGFDKEGLALCDDLFGFCEGVKFATGQVDVQEGTRAAQKAEKIVELLLK